MSVCQPVASDGSSLDMRMMPLSIGRKSGSIPPSHIRYLQADSNYSRIYLVDGSMIMTSKTLKYWEYRLPTKLFVRIHSKYLVNRDRIKQVHKASSAIQLDADVLPVSRRRWACLRRLLAGFSEPN